MKDKATIEEQMDALKKEIGKVAEKIRTKRQTLLFGLPGRLKRDAFDRLEEKGMLTPDRLVSELDLIQEKKSRLSANERDCVMFLCFEGLKNYGLEQEKQQLKKRNNESDNRYTVLLRRLSHYGDIQSVETD